MKPLHRPLASAAAFCAALVLGGLLAPPAHAEDPDAGLNAPWYRPEGERAPASGEDPDAGLNPDWGTEQFCRTYPTLPERAQRSQRGRYERECRTLIPGPDAVPRVPTPIPPQPLYRPDLLTRVHLTGPVVLEDGGVQELEVDAFEANRLDLSPVDVVVMLATEDLSTRWRTPPSPKGSKGERALVVLHRRATAHEMPVAVPFRLDVPADLPEGRYYWCAFIDPDDRVSEVNETNNVYCHRFETEPLGDAEADLGIEEIRYLPEMARAGTRVPFALDVYNDSWAPVDFCVVVAENGEPPTGVSSRQTAKSHSVTTIRMEFVLPADMAALWKFSIKLTDCQQFLSLDDGNRLNNLETREIIRDYPARNVAFRVSGWRIHDDCDGGEGGEWTLLLRMSVEGEAHLLREIWHPGEGSHIVRRAGDVPLDELLTIGNIPGRRTVSLTGHAWESDFDEGGYREDAGYVIVSLTPEDLAAGRGSFDMRSPARGDSCHGSYSLRGTWTSYTPPE